MKTGLCIIFSIFVLELPAQDLRPEQLQSILQQLESLSEKRETLYQRELESALKSIRAAAGSGRAAMEFYEKAIFDTRFAGVTRENTKFRDWKKEQEQVREADAAQTAVRLHLNYLALSLDRVTGKEVEELLPLIIAHARSVEESREVLGSGGGPVRGFVKTMLSENVSNGVFAKWLRLEGRFSGLQAWEMTAGNADGIYEKTILPNLRARKDPALLQYWDSRIKQESERAAAQSTAFSGGQFAEVRRPTLMWNRTKDLLLLGRKGEAINGMFDLIKSHPGHPDLENWIGELQSLLTAELIPASAQPATSGEGGDVGSPDTAGDVVGDVVNE